MLRKTMIALFAIASVAVLAPESASARGGFGGGGFHGGGGGFHGGGGFRGGGIGMGGGGFRAAAMGGGGFRSAAIPAAGFRGGSFAVNGFRGGYHPGFRHRGFPIVAAAVGAGLGYGLNGGYGYGYNDYDYGYPYYANAGYDDSYYYGDSGCYIVRQRLLTPYGWRIRPVQVCN